MYKIKIMNYQPYEYELFQEKLDHLGKQGYYCDDLSFISFFKKVNHPVCYKIDFFKPEGHSRFEKKVSREHFYDKYGKKYKPIYKKRGMHVFVNQKDISSKHPETVGINNILSQRRLRSLAFASLYFLITAFLMLCTFETYTINSWITYGITFVYIGCFILLLTLLYRYYTSFYCYNQLYKKKKISLSIIQKIRSIYVLFSIVSIVMIGGGLLEDYTNAKTLTSNEYTGIRLKDIGISEKSDFTAQIHSSFTIPHYYTVLERTRDDTIISTKIYQLNSETKANQFMQQLHKKPQQYLCTESKSDKNIIYGYRQNTLSTLIFKNKDTVTMVSFNFALSQHQIDTVMAFYQY